VGVTGPSTSRQAALDARLFANAPDLLRMLRELCRILREQMDAPRPLKPDMDPQTPLQEALRQAESLVRLVEGEALVH
jgi:hypothetical protein